MQNTTILFSFYTKAIAVGTGGAVYKIKQNDQLSKKTSLVEMNSVNNNWYCNIVYGPFVQS